MDDLATYGRRLAEQHSSMPPVLLHSALVRHLETVKTLLAGPMAPGLRGDLLAVGAHAAAMAGQLAHSRGRDDETRAHLALAGQLAGSIDLSGLQALALLWTADTLSGVQRAGAPLVEHRHVLDMLDRAEDRAERGCPVAVRAHLLLRQAEERAAAVYLSEAQHYLDRADTTLSRAPEGDDRTRYGMAWTASTAVAFRGSVAVLSSRGPGRPARCLTRSAARSRRPAAGGG